jgi:hypothetical protein
MKKIYNNIEEKNNILENEKIIWIKIIIMKKNILFNIINLEYIWTIPKIRIMANMYSLDIDYYKMQKIEISDGIFLNSDIPIWDILFVLILDSGLVVQSIGLWPRGELSMWGLIQWPSFYLTGVFVLWIIMEVRPIPRRDFPP